MEWIKCSDRMPDDMQEVIVLITVPNAKAWVTAAQWSDPYAWMGDKHREDWENGSWWRAAWSHHRDEVTHWMPLPEPPKEG